jgi:hypothetical protein
MNKIVKKRIELAESFFLSFGAMKLSSCFRHILFAMLTAFIHSLTAQNFTWAQGAGGVGNEAANGVAVDEAGYTYITGNLAGKGEFNGNIYEGKGLYEVILAKYDAAGNLIWLKLVGGKRNDQGNAIKYSNGFLYVTGFFEDTAWFENTMVISKGEADVFLAKYDTNGNLVWVTTGGGTELDYATSLDLDPNGNIFIAGSYEKSIQFDTAQLTTTNIFPESFICKYNPAGKLVWAKTSRGNNTNLLTGIGSAPDGSVYATGFFGVHFAFDNVTVTSNSPSYDIVLAKLDANGNTQWIKTAGSNYEDAANAIVVDRQGNPIIAGYFAGIASFGSNVITYYDYNDAFVAKYDANGNNLWVKAGKGQQLDVAYAVTVDSADNVYSTGTFQGSAAFDGYVVNGTDREIFMVSYTPNGNLRWIDKAGGLNTDCGLSLAVKKNGNVAVCGYYIYSCYFGTLQINYADGNDLFVAEYHPPVVSGIKETELTGISVFPNPVSDFFTVELENALPDLYITIWDVTGRVVYKHYLSKANTINTTGWETGIYFVRLGSGFHQKEYKLMKY